ncbi:MAG: DUF177 domain-containing protein [Clostridiales bacterium]|nr:DUF177 domain-containing protein [Clostridiales bacterium]
MKIDVTEALNKPGKSIDFNCTRELASIVISEDEFVFISPLVILGKLMYTGKDYIAKGNIAVEYSSKCNRCTKAISNSLNFDFYEEYSKVEDEDYPDRYLFENNVIDLELMVLDNISLTMPMKHLCEEKCKGLCAICGGNMNDKDCNCIEQEKIDSSPFAIMKELSFEDEDREV